MGDIKLFAKVHCKGYMAKIRDTVHIQLYDSSGREVRNADTVNDYNSKAIAYRYDEDRNEEVQIADLSEFDGGSVEKTYYERTEAEFDGVLVGYMRLNVKSLIGTDWYEDEHRSYGYCFKKVTEKPKVGVVYFRNNSKRYVLVEDLEEIREEDVQLKDGLLKVTVPGDSKVRRILVMWRGTSDGLLFSPDGSTRDGGKHFSMFWNGGCSS